MLDTPTAPIVHYPGIPMTKYGLVDEAYGGGPKYRIIWAPSRMVTLTGVEKTMTIPMYAGPYALEPVGDFWILESWQSPQDYYAGTEDDWNADPMKLNLGPYPRRGEWIRRETLAVSPSDANIEKLITWLEAGGKRRPIENINACIENLDRVTEDRRQKRQALIGDAMRPFGMAPMVGYGGARTTKTLPVVRSRHELGLPSDGATKALRLKKPPVYQVMSEY